MPRPLRLVPPESLKPRYTSAEFERLRDQFLQSATLHMVQEKLAGDDALVIYLVRCADMMRQAARDAK